MHGAARTSAVARAVTEATNGGTSPLLRHKNLTMSATIHKESNHKNPTNLPESLARNDQEVEERFRRRHLSNTATQIMQRQTFGEFSGVTPTSGMAVTATAQNGNVVSSPEK